MAKIMAIIWHICLAFWGGGGVRKRENVFVRNIVGKTKSYSDSTLSIELE